MDNKLNSSEFRLSEGGVCRCKSHAAILGRLLLKYLRHFRHCSLPSEIGLRGVSQKGHTSSLAKLLGPSRSSNLDLEPSRAVRGSESLIA